MSDGEPALVSNANQQAVIRDNVGQDMKVFWKEFEENFLYKKVSLKVLGFFLNYFIYFNKFGKNACNLVEG